MKFTKLTSSVLAGATLLSILAPTASFAATDGTATGNGGVQLPQNDKTDMGISFGDNTNNGNTGYLRLQMVPHTLDFGNHKTFTDAYPTFTADGKNTSNAANDVAAGYDNTAANKTKTLNIANNSDLAKVEGTAWATVVDKQITRTNVDANNTAASGTWTLSVKSDNELQAVDDNNARVGAKISTANLVFDQTQYARTQDVYGLTGEAQDSTWAADSTATGVTGDDTNVATSAITPKINVTLQANGSTDQTVAKAADGEGQGANVFGWMPSNIKLSLPAGTTVSNAIYKANLTWTLSNTVA